MNLFRKGFVLLFALLFPVIIFLFLKFFGQNEYELSVYNSSCSDSIGKIFSDSNVSLETANNDFSPDRSSGPFELSDFQNQSIFYGVMHAATGGTVQVIGPYTGTSIGEGSQTIKNVLIDSSNVVLRATAESVSYTHLTLPTKA